MNSIVPTLKPELPAHSLPSVAENIAALSIFSLPMRELSINSKSVRYQSSCNIPKVIVWNGTLPIHLN